MRMRRVASAAALLLVCTSPAWAQASFEQVTQDLASPDAGKRLAAVRLLKEAAYPEAAEPVAKLIGDPEDQIQVEAIATELNIFLAQKIVSRKRIGYVIEVRTKIAAAAAFSAGPLALGSRPVPMTVLTALRAAGRDNNPAVGLEALYAFGTLGVTPGGAARRELLHTSGPDLAAMIGAPDAALRRAAVRVLGRLFEKRRGDEPIDAAVGDAVIIALNDNDRAVRGAAMQALGAMRYERALQALTDLFNYYGRGEAAESALDAVARIGHATSSPLLEGQLASRIPSIRGIAIEGLARIGDKTKLAVVQAALSGERGESVRLAGDFANVVLGNGPIEQIAESLGRAKLRDQARGYLVEAVPGRINAFGRYAQDPDARLRADVADIVGLAGDTSALPIVEPLLKDRDPEVVAAAERAVARLRAARSTN